MGESSIGQVWKIEFIMSPSCGLFEPLVLSLIIEDLNAER
jgi:hypothetical protein